MYILEVFEQRNVSTEIHAGNKKSAARIKAREMSKESQYPVIIRSASKPYKFEKYEKGEKVEWSVCKL